MNAPFMPKTAAECAEFLRRFNAWRRWDGDLDEEGPVMPHPKSISFALDMAIQLIEQRGELLAALEQTVDEHGYIADGKNCTLIALKKVLEKAKGSTP